MNIWILQTGEPIHSDNSHFRPMRAMNLTNKLIEKGHKVLLWTSAFDHQNKIHRSEKYQIINHSKNLEIRLIPSRGYKKHLGIERIIDHIQMAQNLRIILQKERIFPDLVFIGFPPIELASVMASWATKNKIPTILDVKDLWPKIFVDVFPNYLKPLAKMAFYPYYFIARKTFRKVSGLCSMTQNYINWCQEFSNRPPSNLDIVSRLTVEKIEPKKNEEKISSEKWKSHGVLSNKENIFFAGTFSTAFDFDTIIKAAKTCEDFSFILCGDGPLLPQIKLKAKGIKNIIFPGWVNQSDLICLARMSIASLAPYKNNENFNLNIPNKIADSLALGKPILSSLSGEVEELIHKNFIGLSYSSPSSLEFCIKKLSKNKKILEEMTYNAQQLYLSDFEFNMVYSKLVNHIKKVCRENTQNC